MALKAPSIKGKVLKSITATGLDTRMIKRFIEIMDSHNLAEIEYESGMTRLKLRKFETNSNSTRNRDDAAPASTPREKAPDPAEVDHPAERIVASPFVGRFYCKPAPDLDPFVAAGSRIEKGATLCIIEAMKLMNEIDSEFACLIVEVLATDGQIVEYGTPLFRVRPL